jgi:hypothetical protein
MRLHDGLIGIIELSDVVTKVVYTHSLIDGFD